MFTTLGPTIANGHRPIESAARVNPRLSDVVMKDVGVRRTSRS